MTAAAQHASVSRPTVYKWLEEPAFQQAVAFARQEHTLTIRDRLLALSTKALDKLEAVLDDPRSTPSVLPKAALAILNRKEWHLPTGAPCPRGSGLKYKRCCGQNAPPVLHHATMHHAAYRRSSAA